MTVLVTGGTRGIGRGIAEAFAAAGHEVVVCARSAGEGQDLPFIAADLRDVTAVDRVVSEVVDRYGGLDVLINNAGGSPPAETATVSPRFSEAIIRLNLIAPLNLCQRANAQMQGQPKGGVILNICSVSGLRGSPTTAAYGAAKAGLLNLTRTLAIEWAPRVRVNAVTPGLVDTGEAASHYPDPAAIAATVPLGRFGAPSDVASACLFLASTEASYISGANLVVDGGGEWPGFLRPSG
jgi:NAD(P)-dependent dehydrogenase (short-subunit alcohol dehydrogenase family)